MHQIVDYRSGPASSEHPHHKLKRSGKGKRLPTERRASHCYAGSSGTGFLLAAGNVRLFELLARIGKRHWAFHETRGCGRLTNTATGYPHYVIRREEPHVWQH